MSAIYTVGGFKARELSGRICSLIINDSKVGSISRVVADLTLVQTTVVVFLIQVEQNVSEFYSDDL